ncbi:MAG: OmpH family outer membrane protein [Nevskia sp.]|nr:OmpH family outer membrane protein [Nevskia sp.]
MMHTRIRALGLAAVLLLASAAAHADVKIAAVRNDLLQNSAQIKAAQAQIQAEVDKRRAAIEAEGKQLSDDVQKYQRDGATMSVDQRDKTEKDLNTRKAQLDYDQRKAQDELQARSAELQNAAVSKIRDVIFQVGKEKGYDLVVSDAFIINPSVDITDDVLKRLNAQAGGK